MAYLIAPKVRGRFLASARPVGRRVLVRRAPPPLSGILDDVIGAAQGGLATLGIGYAPPDLVNVIASYTSNDDAGQIADIVACLEAANAQVAQLDQQINDTSANWNPSGFYAPADLVAITQVGVKLIAQAQQAISQTGDQALDADAQSQLQNASDQLNNKGQDSLQYTAQIDPSAKVIEAPGFKRWVVSTMQACRDAFTTASVVQCNRPGWMTVVGAFIVAFSAWKAAILAMKDAVVALGDKIQKIPDAIGTLYTVAKFAILGGLGYIAYVEYKKYKGRRGQAKI